MKILLALVLSLVSSLSFAQSKIQKPYVVFGKKYHPISHQQAANFKESGIATWYDYDHQRITANGSKFSGKQLTAAHKTLPFGTKVRVTNKANGKSVVVTITDRGPFGAGRIIDLTPAAFNSIGNTKSGILKVDIQTVK